ncbi:PhnA-like protein [Microvirga sp. CF3016]|nr:PhnA-like protein [Microvirga sp. CF3016]MEE1611905.1 PhnA-like protein [Microvirga sp. CF3016]
MSPVTPAEDARTIMLNKVTWGAVFAGVVVMLVTQLILNLLGIGIGAATLDPAAGADGNPSASSFSIGAGIWFVVAGVLASLAGGYAAGRLAGKPKESTASWHGLTAWALATLVIFYLLTTTVGGLVGGAYRTVTSALGNVTQAVGSTAQTAAQAAAPSLAGAADPFSSIEQQIRGATGGNDPAAVRDAAIASVRAALTGNEQQAADARNRAAEALARAQNIPVDQARIQVQQYEQQYRQSLDQARQRATEAADAASRAVSTGALLAALGLILGAVAAWFGGRMGTVEPTITARLGMSRSAATEPVVHSGGTNTAVETERTPRSTTTTKTGNTRPS